MKLEYTDGCICTSLSVDGKEFNIDLTEQERLDIRNRLIEEAKSDSFFVQLYSYYIDGKLYDPKDNFEEYSKRCDEKMEEFGKLSSEEKKEKVKNVSKKIESDDYFSQYTYIAFLDSEGDYENLGYCVCCGDTVYKWTYEL